jgi:hypothetical protein
MGCKCKRCYYGHLVNVGANGEMMLACLYILHEFTRRPCPPGKDCTVYRPLDKSRRWVL